jgi:hypothetical protein
MLRRRRTSEQRSAGIRIFAPVFGFLPFTRRARAGLEGAETHQCHRFTLGNGIDDRFEHRVKGFRRRSFREFGTGSDGIDHFRLVHGVSL